MKFINCRWIFDVDIESMRSQTCINIFIAMYSHQSYAPFGSVSLRAKKGQKKEEKPGPGSYEVSLPFIHPIVQTIRKKNNNVIVKLGHMGTASFQSD
jgi:hypothetical protein